MHSHAWPNYSRYRKGLPSVLPSSMDGLWSGEYVAQEEEARWPELFLYSKSDFYLPYEHLEQEVLARRKALGRDYRTVRRVTNFPIPNSTILLIMLLTFEQFILLLSRISTNNRLADVLF